MYQSLMFIKSALTKKERTTLLLISIGFLPLFILGVAFGLFLTKIIILPFLSNLVIDAGISNSWSVTQFVKFFVTICLGMGLAFQMPLVIFFLVKTRILQVTTIKKMRKYVFISLAVFAALITPPDIFSLTIVLIPLFLLFELSLLISKLIKS
jgi:sec-independent protein translocase protein TatC